MQSRLQVATGLLALSSIALGCATKPAGEQANFDVSRDGSRIIIPVSQSQSYQLVVVPNWLTEFRQRLAASRKERR